MLRLYTSYSAYGVKKYFETADYYSQGNETVGCWGGKLAGELGLEGTVTKEAFERMCDNLHPFTAKQLTPRMNDNRRVGDDFILSLPKDVGSAIMLAPVAERDALLDMAGRRAHQIMGIIERDVQTRVRKHGAFSNRDTGNMAWAAFLHTTARPVDGKPPDPHPHWHMFTFNATNDPEEARIKAIELGNVYRDRPYYEALFFSMVAGDLAERGYGLERRADGKWGLAGMQWLGGIFSKRTDGIEEEAKRLNITDPGRKAGLGAKTRAKKQKELTPEQLRAAWLDQLGDDQRDALARVFGKEMTPGREVTAREAVAYAIAHLSEQRSLFAERELLREALLFGLGGVTLEQIEAELPRQGVIVGEIAGDAEGRRFVTTGALQAEERYIVGRAARGGNACPVGVPEGLSRTLASGKRLNDGQWKVVTGLLESGNRVNVVEGPAGAGKSTMLAAYDQGMRLAGAKVIYLATTVKAAEVLAEDGFEVYTVAHFLRAEKMHAAASGGRVVIDESSMLGHKDAVKLFQIAERHNLKLNFVGDPLQHGSVPRGSFLRVLKDHAHIEPHRLTQIMRQEDADYRQAAQLLSEGKTLDGFNILDQKEWVREIADDAERCRAIAADYVQAATDGASCLVVSPTHREAAGITAEIRRQLRQAGKLGSEETTLTHLVNANASEAERGQAVTYRPGDVLIFHQNAKGFAKGERITVADPAAVPLEHAGKFSLYRPQAIVLAAGDRIRFTGTVEAVEGGRKYKNGDTRAVLGITDDGSGIRLDDGQAVAADCGLFRSAFVETSFGAQGQTVKRVILGMSAASLPAVNQEQMYVSASRAKQSVHVFTDDKAAVKAAIQRSSRKHAALDLVPVAATRDWRKDDADRKRRLTELARIAATHAAAMTPPERPGPGGGRMPPPHAARLALERQGWDDGRGR
jgi:conjugative relaxase-like TrwC/TraI family protein